MKQADMSKFCMFILCHGRPQVTDTYDHLRSGGYTGKIIILIDNEDKLADEYYKRYGKDNVYMFDKLAVSKHVDPMNNFGSRKAMLFARNVSFQVAKELGYDAFCQLDDDYYYFGHRGKYGAKKTNNLDLVCKYMVEFLLNTPTKAIAFSQGGDHIGGYKGEEIPMKRKAMNSWFCLTDRPFAFYGVMNDDVNAYLRNGYVGGIFFTYMPFQLDQVDTQQLGGGMTEAYQAAGTYVKSFYSVMMCPAAVKIKLMGLKSPRLHHAISWSNTTPCIISEQYKKQ